MQYRLYWVLYAKPSTYENKYIHPDNAETINNDSKNTLIKRIWYIVATCITTMNY